MKNYPPILITAAAAAIFLGLAASSQAVPGPPLEVPESGSTGMLLGAVLCGLGLLGWKLKR